LYGIVHSFSCHHSFSPWNDPHALWVLWRPGADPRLRISVLFTRLSGSNSQQACSTAILRACARVKAARDIRDLAVSKAKDLVIRGFTRREVRPMPRLNKHKNAIGGSAAQRAKGNRHWARSEPPTCRRPSVVLCPTARSLQARLLSKRPGRALRPLPLPTTGG
jgi:hypothetical protein